MSKIRVFVSFDIERDGELFEELLAQASSAGFAVSGCSERLSAADVLDEKLRRRIREADQVILICSEHSEASPNQCSEIRIAQEEKKPYFLLWGRREIMCSKPMGARTAEGMYSWTPQILQDQLLFAARSARSEALAESLRNARGG